MPRGASWWRTAAAGAFATLFSASLSASPASLRGTISRAATGEPVDGARITLRGQAASLAFVTGRDGAFRFLHVHAGAYRLEVACGSAIAEANVVLRPGQGDFLRVRVRETVPPSPKRIEIDVAAGARSDTPGRSFGEAEIHRMPHSADPWSLARTVPGLVLDRVDVGGSETAQQSLLVGYGDGGGGATWVLDGVEITDAAAPGSSSVFPALGNLDHVRVDPAPADVRVRSAGTRVTLESRDVGDRPSGGAWLAGSSGALQADNLPSELAGRPFRRNVTQGVYEIAAFFGRPVLRDRLWLWGGAHRNGLSQDTWTGHKESLRTQSLTGRARLRLGSGTLRLLGLWAEKVHEDRDTAVSTSHEARWRQSGPAHLFGIEDVRRFGSASVLSRLSWLGAGFRLDPYGGMSPSAYEDPSGVLRRSYYRYETSRPRLHVSTELSVAKSWAGLDHGLNAGLGYEHGAIRTQAAWPGNKVFGLERQSVFFKAFQLTGFAIATRDQDGRSVEDRLFAFAEDVVRLGSWSLAAGVRVESLSGRSTASAVPANPEFPDLLPAVSYAGSEREIRWTDVLPRAAVAWDPSGDSRLVAGASYAAYAGPLSAADVAFDNPVGREVASVTYYWIDRNADQTVQRGELDLRRGRVGASGLDPDNPGSSQSPHAVAEDLRAPRTHRFSWALDRTFGPRLQASLTATLSRTGTPLWRPVRNLTMDDYEARGSVRGDVLGVPYAVVFFAPASVSKIVPGNGRLLASREGYRQDAVTVTVSGRGSVSKRLRWEAWGAYCDWREVFEDRSLAVQDPTPVDTEPLISGGVVAVRPGGLGRADVVVNARWSGGAQLRAALPARVDAALQVLARDGFPTPFYQVASTGDPTAGAKNVLVTPRLDSYRLPALATVDLLASRAFKLRQWTLVARLSVFNVTNASTELQVTRDVELPILARPVELLRPRIVRLGFDLRF